MPLFRITGVRGQRGLRIVPSGSNEAGRMARLGAMLGRIPHTPNQIVVKTLPWMPGPVFRWFADPYVAGATLQDALRVVEELNATRAKATLDVLGEDITDFSEAEATAAEYARALNAISQERLAANLSIKLTGFGIDIDPKRCRELVLDLAKRVAAKGSFMRVDMESSAYTDRTLELVRALRKQALPVGCVLQACLRRTQQDAAKLAQEGVSVRLCKGIYPEEAKIAFQSAEEIRASYRATLRTLFQGKGHVAIATHDEALIDDALKLIAELKIPRDRYDFEMLLGVREEKREELLARGEPVLIYVPYGKSWEAYCRRRLKENPSIVWHALRARFRRRRRQTNRTSIIMR